MRLPTWLYRRLDDLVRRERSRRERETARRLTERDHRLRAWANQALVAHNAGRCVDQCPYAHPPRLQPRSNDGKVTP